MDKKIIRNKTAVDYLFNDEAYDFNYQFENTLPKPIQLYPGDELATRCVYTTTNKSEITLGGERTKDEMCIHMFTYYPRMNNMYGCFMQNSEEAWKKQMNITGPLDYDTLRQRLLDLKWTPESTREWQEFYNNASRFVFYGQSGNFSSENLPRLPQFKDLQPAECIRGIPSLAIR